MTSENKPRWEEGEALTIRGYREHYDYGDWPRIPDQWQRFSFHFGKVPGQDGHTAYGVCFDRLSGFDYLCGVGVSGAAETPEFASVSIPAQRYAVFSHDGHVSQLHATIGKIWGEWLPAAGVRALSPENGGPAFFERYGERFNPRTGMGDMEVWIPIHS